MAGKSQQEPSQQCELTGAESVSVQPNGPASTGSEVLERLHKRTSRMKTGILGIFKTSPSSHAQSSSTVQPIDTRPNNHLDRPTREQIEQTLAGLPETNPADTTEPLRPAEQQNAYDRTQQHEQLNDRERILKVRDDEEKAFEGEALQNWLHRYVGSFLSRNNRTNNEPKFWLCLKAHEIHANHHERSQYIAVHLLSDQIRHKTELAGQLMQQDFSRNRQNFEIKVFDVSGFELKGYEQSGGIPSFGSPLPIQISLSGAMATLCGAQITLASSRLEPGTYPLIWTCGGLISVDDLIYALTVSHPLASRPPKPQGPTQTKIDPQEYRSEQALVKHAWGDFGRTAFHANSDSLTGTNNNDWLLIEVKKHMQLPNVHFYNKAAKASTRGQAVSQDDYHLEGPCQLITSHGVMPGSIVRGSSYLKFGYTTLRTLQILIEEPLVQGDSGSWVVSEDSNVIGVVVAGADGAFDEERRPIAFVLRMTDIYAALEQAIPRAKPRVLSNTENDILRHRQIHAEDDNLPGMWSLYAADIINRFRENTGEIDPGNLIIEHLPSRHLYLRSFLMLGQVFPCDEHVRERLHNTKLMRWKLRVKRIGTRAIDIWDQLHGFERGENFIILLKSLVQAGREFMLHPLNGRNATKDRPSKPRFMATHLYHSLQYVGNSQVFSSWLTVSRDTRVNRMVIEVIHNLILYSDLLPWERPGSGLINDLVQIAAITPPLFRRLDWRHPIFTKDLPPSDIARILAKASYAEKHSCFFVYEGPLALEIRSFLTVACRSRCISAWDGKDYDRRSYLADIGNIQAINTPAAAPYLFVGEEHGKDLPTTGRLIRCPELYEHLYVGRKMAKSDDAAGAYSTKRRVAPPAARDWAQSA